MNDIQGEDWQQFREYLKGDKSAAVAYGESKKVEAREEYKRFLHHATLGECYVCKKSIKTFSTAAPCPHWLLRPNGVKKQHVYEMVATHGYLRSAAYIRWFANFKAPFRNINDLNEEGDPSAVFHWSCCYEHIKWTFKCSQTDLKGHVGTKYEQPHFHFEMKLSGQVFVKFNDFHVPFTDEDLFWLRGNDDTELPVRQSFAPHGSGMQDTMNIDSEYLVSHLQRSDENGDQDAALQLDCLVFREEGIPTELLHKAIEASKKSGKTITFHLTELGLEPKVIISPAKSVPDKEERTNPRKKKI